MDVRTLESQKAAGHSSLVCVAEGDMRNYKNSISPDGALMDVRTPKAAGHPSPMRVSEGNMRNYK